MVRANLLILAYLLGCTSTTVAAPGELHNANHIFNALHSAMRQWGSSLYHNGMSFFVASVPAGTQLYHGSGNNDPVTGMEWVAFEAEHALIFANPRPRGSSPRLPNKPQQKYSPLNMDGSHQQIPINADEHAGGDEVEPAWLQTYSTKHDMKFLYIDGTSAGKTDKGTLDSTDYLLLSREDHTDPLWEQDRATLLCSLIQDKWGSDLSGIIRMEAGFEIIMCSFADSLDLLDEMAIKQEQGDYHLSSPSQFQYMRAMQSRYHGIGEGRVVLDYERMATAYRDLEMPDRNEEHRLNQTKRSVLDSLRNEVKGIVLDKAPDRFDGVNWQAVADMIVLRYADPLQQLAVIESTTHLESRLYAILRPFVHDLAPNATAEAHRCSRQHLTGVLKHVDSKKPSLAQQAVTSIAERICGTLVDAAHAKDASLEQRVSKIRDLVEYLRWTTFKECKGCAFNEVCMVAMWPFGDTDDHYNPSCKNETSKSRSASYWRWGSPPLLQDLSMHGRVQS